MNLNVQNTNILYIFHLLQDFYFINLMGYFCQHLFPVPQRDARSQSRNAGKKSEKVVHGCCCCICCFFFRIIECQVL